MFPAIPDALVQRYDAPAPRYTSYPTAPVWTKRVGPDAYAEALSRADGRDEPLSLYAHLPFCRERCSFCGCNVAIARTREPADRYLDALEQELATVAARLPRRRKLSQIHWGGGTPTFLEEDQLVRLWRAIGRHFEVLPAAEVSVEVNPETTSLDQLSLLRSFGFNRLSMGVQDLDPEVQSALRRHQPAELTARMLAHARGLGFTGINFDLIYGLPLQTRASWSRTIEEIVRLRPDRLALYGFAFLPELKPHQKRLGQFGLPQGGEKLALFRLAYEAFTAAGYRAIGMDHFALPDDELSRAQERRALTRNFQGYTVQAASDVVAFGVTGISDVDGVYAQNGHALPGYEAAARAGRLCTERGFVCSAEDRLRRSVITRLMCNFFVDLGPDGARMFAPELERLRPLADDGLVRISGARLELTELGRIFVRNVASVFDGYLDQPGARFSRSV